MKEKKEKANVNTNDGRRIRINLRIESSNMYGS